MSEVPLYRSLISQRKLGQTPNRTVYRATFLMRNRTPQGPYSRPTPRALRLSYGGGAFSYERGTPVGARNAQRWLARDERATGLTASAEFWCRVQIMPYVCERERERERESVCVCERERKSVCLCV